jgi:hypothetical protein
MLEWEPGKIGAGDAGAFDENNLGSNRLEGGAEMALAFERNDRFCGRIDAVGAKDIEIDRRFGAAG